MKKLLCFLTAILSIFLMSVPIEAKENQWDISKSKTATQLDEKYQTKGQSILNVVQLGLGAIVGNLVGGKLIRLLGYEKGYLLMAGITTLMTICALIVYFWKNREQRNGGDVCEI